MVVGEKRSEMTQIDRWPDAAWHRLMDAVVDPSRVWSALPSCPYCRRHVAGPDCEPDGKLCWRPVKGTCS